MPAVPYEPTLPLAVECDAEGEDAAQEGAVASDHDARRDARGDGLRDESRFGAGRGVVAQGCCGGLPGLRVPLEPIPGGQDGEGHGTHESYLVHGADPVGSVEPEAVEWGLGLLALRVT